MSAREGLITPLTCDATGPLTTLRDADGSGLVFNINAVIAGKLIAAVNSHAALVEALQAMLSMHDDIGCCWVAADAARAALRLAHGETGGQA